ncbi:MAG TPA: MFS transporter [Stellaceae bacterium]|nr:MFS transporter [Stellaceae bacterium]
MRLGPMRLLPPDAQPEARLLLLGRGLRAFGDGFVSLILPLYLKLLGFHDLAIGILTAATLAGSAGLTLLVGFRAQRYGHRLLLLGATLLMIGTGMGFALETRFWPLLLVGFLGTLNPSSGDVSLFLPLEQALLADVTPDRSRTALFAAYSLTGSLLAALGALAAGLPEIIDALTPLGLLQSVQAMFALYALLGLATYLLYRRLPGQTVHRRASPARPLGPSRRIVLVLAGLFSLDAFGGGFIVQSLLALWLFDRFGLSVAAAGYFFFGSGLLAAASYLAAARIARRIGLINTMVWTHLPSNLLLALVPFAPNLGAALALLLLRSALSNMDVPTRTSYVMAVVTPEERAAAASVTSVPRSLAAAASPVAAGWMLTLSSFGWPLVAAGAIKAVYDLLLLIMFRHRRPPEEREGRP